jgi:hypothetical protein
VVGVLVVVVVGVVVGVILLLRNVQSALCIHMILLQSYSYLCQKPFWNKFSFVLLFPLSRVRVFIIQQPFACA